MARYQLIHNGDIKEYYSDESEWTSYECVGCGATTKNGFLIGADWHTIVHSKDCKVIKKWKKELRDADKLNKIITVAFSKLTKKEISALEKYYHNG